MVPGHDADIRQRNRYQIDTICFCRNILPVGRLIHQKKLWKHPWADMPTYGKSLHSQKILAKVGPTIKMFKMAATWAAHGHWAGSMPANLLVSDQLGAAANFDDLIKFGDRRQIRRSQMFIKLGFEFGCDVILMSHPITRSLASKLR